MESCINSSSDTENEGNGVFIYNHNSSRNSRPKKRDNHLGTLVEESSNVKLDKEASITEKQTPFEERLPEKMKIRKIIKEIFTKKSVLVNYLLV